MIADPDAAGEPILTGVAEDYMRRLAADVLRRSLAVDLVVAELAVVADLKLGGLVAELIVVAVAGVPSSPACAELVVFEAAVGVNRTLGTGAQLSAVAVLVADRGGGEGTLRSGWVAAGGAGGRAVS